MGKDNIEWVFDDAKATIISRGVERDQPDGERTIPRCVTAFNAITGHNLSNTDGWLFMEVLKKCRSVQGSYKYDDYRDGVGYAALRAEEARMEYAANKSSGQLADEAEERHRSYRVVVNTKEHTVRPLTEEEQRPGAVMKLTADEQISRQFLPSEDVDNRGGA